MRKIFRTLSDVLQSPWAQCGPRESSIASTTDRVLHSTRLEDAIYDDLRQDDEALDRLETDASKKLRSFPALSRDVFQAFYALSPRRNDEAQLSVAARKFNSRILDHAMEQDDYATLKNICEGRELLSYEAASEFTARMAGELDSLLSEMGGEKGSLNTLEKLENSRDEAMRKLGELLEQHRRSAGPNPLLEQELLAAANMAQSKQQQVDAVSKLIDTSMARNGNAIESVINVAIQAATGKAQEAQAILGAWGDDPGNLRRTPVNQELLDRVRKNEKLLEISKYLGRFREMFAQARKNGYAYGRGETYSLELGNNLSRAITSELAMLAHPATIPLFLKKYQSKRIKQYRRREPVYKGSGDIICCLDESDSTEGDAAAWGKAVAMALLEIAESQGRKFALIHFSGPGSVQTDCFLPRSYTVEDKFRAAETFLGGGTDYETPLAEAVRLMEQEAFENADIVFITDGNCALSQDASEQLEEIQTARHFTVTGILLDANSSFSDFSLSTFCRKIYRTSQLSGNEIIHSIHSDRVRNDCLHPFSSCGKLKSDIREEPIC